MKKQPFDRLMPQPNGQLPSFFEGASVAYYASRTKYDRSLGSNNNRYKMMYKSEVADNSQIYPGELLFQVASDDPRDSDGGVFSKFNGEIVPVPIENPAKAFRFVGISRTHAIVKRSSKDIPMVDTVHQSKALMCNNGYTRVVAGNRVYVKPPPIDPRCLPDGYQTSKSLKSSDQVGLVFGDTLHIGSALDMMATCDEQFMELLKLLSDKKTMLSLVDAAKKLVDVAESMPRPSQSIEDLFAKRYATVSENKPAVEALETLLSVTIAIQTTYNSVKGTDIGRALSSAEPGQTFFVLPD